MKTIVQSPGKVLVVALRPGELLLESIVSACEKHRIVNGAVVSGIGTLKSVRLHAIKGTGFPPKNLIFQIKKPLELLALSGIIADHEPHLHAVVSWLDKKTWCGHLHEGSEVAYLCEIAILALGGPAMKRHVDAKLKLSLLGPARR